MRVGIIGYGFVGKALHNGLKKSNKVRLIDPKLNTDETDLLDFNPNIVFVCVPTPMAAKGGQNLYALSKVIKNLVTNDISCPIVLKSTVLPDGLELIKTKLPNIIYNPEFLREKHANEDFLKSKLIVIGGNDNEVINFIESFYKNETNCDCENIVKTDLVTASLIKFTINSFLATKVSFFNELNNIFKLANTQDSWKNFITYLSFDERMGDSHMSVPGHDDKYGFGGACLPKDSKAFVEYASSQKVELNVLNTAIKVNNKIRHQYNVDERESDQNINFSDID